LASGRPLPDKIVLVSSNPVGIQRMGSMLEHAGYRGLGKVFLKRSV